MTYQKVCIVCRKPFTERFKDQVFCSMECSETNMKTLPRTEAIKFRARLQAVADGRIPPDQIVMPNGKLGWQCPPEYIVGIIKAMAAHGIEPPTHFLGRRIPYDDDLH
jgi:predicted nucleic acid-binding Zn ribbon protein